MKSILLSLLLYSFASFGQQAPLTFFRLPILADSGYIPGEAYISCNYQPINTIALKNYKGPDSAIAKLSRLIRYTSLNQKASYISLSDNTDTTIESSLTFYHFFTAHSANPKLMCRVTAGKYTIFFVRLEPRFPLMTFCLVQEGNTLLNHTGILQHPVVSALAAAINHSYSSAPGFSPLKTIPAKNSQVVFDSIFRNSQSPVSFHFDLLTLNIPCHNGPDATAIDPGSSLNREVNLYCSTLAALKSGDFKNYYAALGEKSARSVSESLTGIAENEMELYQSFKSSYSFADRSIDLGTIKLLIVKDPRNEDPTASRSVYLNTYGDGSTKWINENHEFYLDDLLRMPEFMKVLYEQPANRKSD